MKTRDTRNSATPDPLRRKLLFSVPGGLALASSLTMVSCGGGGGGASNAATVSTSLPAGVSAKEVTLVSGGSEAPLVSGGNALKLADDALSMVSAVHSSDRMVAFGMVRAGATGQVIGARSSAEALLFLAMGGAFLDTADRVRVMDAVHADPAAASLAALIESRWATDPFALDGPDPQITNAVIAAFTSVRAAGLADRKRDEATSQHMFAVQPLQRIEPGNAQSGVTVVQAEGSDGAPGLRIQNTKRRPGIAHVYKTGYTPVEGAPFELALAEPLYERIEVPSTQSLSIFNALKDIVAGTAPWSPVESARYGMPLHPNSERTTYELVYVTPVYDRPEPAFYQEVRYSLQRSAWREELAQMYEQAQMDLVFGAVLEALGFGGIKYSSARFATAIAAIRAGGTTDVIALLNQASRGSALLPGFRAWLASVSSGNAIVSGAYRVGVSTLVQQADAQFAANLAAGNLSRARLVAFRAAVNVLLAVTVVAGVFDTAAQYKDLHDGEHAFRIVSTLVAPKVLISPSSGKLARGSDMQLTARVTGTENLTLKYVWTLSGSDLANLSDGAGHVGITIETDSDKITLATTPSTQGTLKIVVEAFVVRGSTKESIGKATSNIEVDQTALDLLPATARIARTGGTQSFSLLINPPPVDSSLVSYEWKCASQYGSLASGGKTTSSATQSIISTQATAVYTGRSDNEGGTFETIEVIAFTNSGGVRTDLGKTTAEVFIKQQYNLMVSPADCDVPTDTQLPLHAGFQESVPANATVKWTWTHGGAGTFTPPATDGGTTSQALLATGSSESSATITVQAVVSVPNQPDFRPLPITVALRVRKGVRTITMNAPGGVFACGPTCGVTDYSAFIVPRIPGATGYKAVFSGFGYGPCNRTVTWTSEKGDGGGCNFPITYHPFSAREAAKAWAVWIGFGGPINEGTCTVTITLPA
jgi:hypothetical protein